MKMNEIEKEGNKRGFWMSRVPQKTKDEFTAFALEDYEDDYGMALKAIWESYKRSSITELLAEKILDLEERINLLTKKEDKIEEKKIKLCSGKKIKGGKEKNEI